MNSITLPVFAPVSEVARGGAEALADQALGPRDIRFVRTLRISVTDHCNFRCIYCMPEEGVDFLDKQELLTYEEIVTIARAAIALGISEFKITGGEPLLRRDLDSLIRMLRALPGCEEISLTTNGLLLDRFALPLARAGVDRVTVSVDTLRPDRFRAMTRTGDLDRVWAGIHAAEAAGMGLAKINTVVLRDHNLDEVADIAALTLSSPRSVRFIEFMPLAKSRVLMDDTQFVPYAEIRARIEDRLGPLCPADPDVGNGPARVFRLEGGLGRIGFIHAMSAPFCATCNRLRLTPEGQLRSCLFDGGEVDVRRIVREGGSQTDLRRAFVDCVVLKPDQHKNYGNRQMSSIGG
ncbi:MAG: GTP 3',8-cyclase MoaA [Phycisphaerales bacterium]|nr:GTP 3',8-cyclase MoaA [Phycisphaerales bacterium]